MVTACWASVRASVLPLSESRTEVLGFHCVVDSDKSNSFLGGEMGGRGRAAELVK